MNQLIQSIQRDWLKAKSKAQAQCERAGRHDVARKLAECQMFAGYEDLPELVRLMFSAQGREFMTSFEFPKLNTFRKFKPYNPERLGVYIDFGEITLTDTQNVFLVGDTTAVVKCRKTAAYTVCLMCGAKATVIASGYSVVKIENDKKSQVAIMTQDNAKVL
ncbi:hypothetical protein [Sangeribacter muris]|jgi:hypothetical protein|uniref:hypothetical protein n=1 Tax=Sangeribacter muris TaxID=2880703 RepID=UPI00244E036C|nr:hypothetical protein [Sangeribacter muris]